MKECFELKHTKDVIVIDCESNIYNNVKDLFKLFPTSILKCNCGRSYEIPFADVEYSKLLEYGMKELQQCFHETTRTCDQCKQKLTTNEFGNIVFVDTQSINNQSILERLGDIPSRLNLKNADYNLKSVIEYFGGGTVGHNCRL